MGFFHKLAVGLKRIFASKPMNVVRRGKSFGDEAEFYFEEEMEKRLPESHIKTNIPVETKSGKSEIDCLLEYEGKLFIIEVKHWKGILTENGNVFLLQRSRDSYDVNARTIKSPFLQVKRQASLLKELTKSNPWINVIVYFCDADEVNAVSDNVWFKDIDSLVNYIKTEGRSSKTDELKKCFNGVSSTDFLYRASYKGEESLHCIINPESLSMTCSDDSILNKEDIRRIDVIHHFSYDTLEITLRDGTKKTMNSENLKLKVKEYEKEDSYSISRIDTIIFGNDDLILSA